jgi:hypothetical protein
LHPEDDPMTAILERYGLDKLSDDEKRFVASALIDTLDPPMPDDEIPEWHWEIIRERLAEADANPDQGILWSDLKKKWAAEE